MENETDLTNTIEDVNDLLCELQDSKSESNQINKQYVIDRLAEICRKQTQEWRDEL